MHIRYYGDKLSKRIAKTPEGFLICQDVPISRTGYQEYLASELSDEPVAHDRIIPVYRPADEVFDIRSLASFEGKPVTNEHPNEDVTPQNYQTYACGHVQNVHAGEGEDSDKVLADLYITDPDLIDSIMSGKREVSCGYYAEEKRDDSGKLCQTKIRGNHVAVVSSGRAGKKVCIRDKNSFDGRNINMRRSLTDYIEGLRYLDSDDLVDDDLMTDDEFTDDDYLDDEFIDTRYQDDEEFADDDEVVIDDDELMDDDFMTDEELVGDDDYLDDDIMVDDDEVMDDDYLDEDLEDDDLMTDDDYLDDDFEDEDEVMDDDDLNCDDDYLDDEFEDDDLMADDDLNCDDDYLDEDDIVSDDDYIDEDLMDEDYLDEDIEDDDIEDDDIMTDDDYLDEDLEDDDDIVSDDDYIDEDLMDDDDVIMDEDLEDDDYLDGCHEDDDTMLDSDDFTDDDIMTDDDFMTDEDLMDEEFIGDEEIIDQDPMENDSEKTAALKEIAGVAKDIKDPEQRKKVQDTVYRALSCNSQMKDIMRITQQNIRNRASMTPNIDYKKQQAIYDSFNPHK